MDLITGTEVTVARVVPVPPERMWELITAVDRIGKWSPETIDGGWGDDEPKLVPGTRFTGRNRFPNGLEATAVCEITEVVPGEVFAWSVLDEDGAAGSLWRYHLSAGEGGTTVVRQTFRHGPGDTGAREEADAAAAMDDRLVALCANMLATIAAMSAEPSATA
ncbi:SRPBCC family protein [Actinoplanes palleronii]|uniref:SRPBCC family protein n=1 Tax=Actinoplanes palleronii TaxID=113570 RepID=A0ABQ4B910_9ACTN|nr:SRPBCC family protein [Actinoplanes palleronii]GIE67127.1 hypothetical protein Apa02nite_032350 [Actinoplanes palleronii]